MQRHNRHTAISLFLFLFLLYTSTCILALHAVNTEAKQLNSKEFLKRKKKMTNKKKGQKMSRKCEKKEEIAIWQKKMTGGNVDKQRRTRNSFR